MTKTPRQPQKVNPRYLKPPACAGCSLEHAGFGFAPAVGPRSSRILLVGEALGWEEAVAGEPFFGAAGGVLSRVLRRAGIERSHVRIANVVSCFPGDTLVHAQGLRGAYRRYYEGPMVTITTERGVLTATPNHPILTPRGWIAAGEIVEGHDLVEGCVSQRTLGGDPHIDRPPVRIEEAFDALAVTGVTQRTVDRDVNFHGDGRDGEIDVVSLDRELGHWAEAAPPQPHRDMILKAANVHTGDLLGTCARYRTALDLVRAWYTAACGLVSSRYEVPLLVPGGPLPAQAHGGAAVADLDARSLQHQVQSLLPDAEFVGEALDAVPVAVQPTRVLKVERFRWHGLVYNLATWSEQYTAAGHIVHNCRPPGDFLVGAPYEQHAIQMCRQYLQPYLNELPDDGVVVALGATPLQAVLGLYGTPGVAVKDFHGTVNRDPSGRFWVVPTFHPSHLQRGAMNLLDVVTEDVKLAERVSLSGHTPRETTLVVDPPVEWFSRWVDAHLAKVAHDRDAVGLDADTEFTIGSQRKPDDEGEITGDVGNVTLTRFNFGNDGVLGGTVLYAGDYISHVDRLLSGIAKLGGWIYWWNKYADLDPLLRAGHDFAAAENLDLMWLAHHIQSDLPRGLGFWAPMACNYGPWKHWSKQRELEGQYAACDGVKTTRVRQYLLAAAHRLGMMDMFLRDWHERDKYVLRPSHVMGVPVNKPVLVEYHEEMQRKLARVLTAMKACEAVGVRKPKLGYAKRPKGAMITPPTCGNCQLPRPTKKHLKTCLAGGAVEIPATYAEPTPPPSILGKAKQTKTGLLDQATGTAQTIGGEAKFQYLQEGVTLVQTDVSIEVLCCESCGAEGVGAKHRCAVRGRLQGGARGQDRAARQGGQLRADTAEGSGADRPAPRLVPRHITQPRWFWQLPFNPDAAAQILAYIEGRGIEAPVDKKRVGADGRPKKTTNKEALKKLAKEYKDLPFFQLQLDWKAVQKVDATYAVGTLKRLDRDDRVHPEYVPKPSTLRDSAINPNLTNVVADKSGPEALSAGFRRCIEARDGVPTSVTPEEYTAWEARWGLR